MDQRHAASAYREATFENAPPIKIVRMLYQGALRFLDQAEQQDPQAAGSRYAYLLMRADAVVVELRMSLARQHAPTVSENLERLYLFVEERLHAAIRERDKSHIGPARQVLLNLLEAWQQVEVSSAPER